MVLSAVTNYFVHFGQKNRKKKSAEGCSECSIGGVCSISIRIPMDMDAKEADAIAAAESVDLFIFSKLSLPRPVGNPDFLCCHYRNMKRVQEPLQHKLVSEFSLQIFPFYLGYSSYFIFTLFSSPFLVMIFKMLVHFTEKCLSINIS